MGAEPGLFPSIQRGVDAAETTGRCRELGLRRRTTHGSQSARSWRSNNLADLFSTLGAFGILHRHAKQCTHLCLFVNVQHSLSLCLGRCFRGIDRLYINNSCLTYIAVLPHSSCRACCALQFNRYSCSLEVSSLPCAVIQVVVSARSRLEPAVC